MNNNMNEMVIDCKSTEKKSKTLCTSIDKLTHAVNFWIKISKIVIKSSIKNKDEKIVW